MASTQQDAIIATQINQSLKTCATQFAHSAVETGTPQVREIFAKASQDAIHRQQQLYELMERRGWYAAIDARQEDIHKVMPQLQALMPTPAGVR